MAQTLKSHTPISARSPYFIDCVAASGTIVSAQLVVTVQRGSRLASVTSMTDVKSYTLTKTDAVDGIIVFEISALVRDFFEHEYLEWTTPNEKEANVGQVYFLKVVKTITNSGGAETPVTTYYTIKDGYGSFKDGVNFEPSTGATGNYDFPETVAFDTDVTIMATDCYRQIGQDSYALVGFNLGEFDRKHSETKTESRVKFGSGELWKTTKDAMTNVVRETIPSVDTSPTRLGSIEQSIQYIPLGKKNMLTDWISGEEYLRVGHFVYAQDIGGLATVNVSDESTASGGNIVDNGNGTYTITTTSQPAADTTSVFIIIDPCGAFLDNSEEIWTVESVGTLTLTISTTDQPTELQMDCAISNGTINVERFYNVTAGTNIIASINDQPVLRYEIICEPKYSVIDCLFINKWGCWDSFSFLKKSMKKFSTTSNTYRRSIGFVDRGPLGLDTPTYSYSLTDHQKVQYNKNGIESITVNTGFVDESFSLLLEEMMLSEKIYLIIDDVVEPVVLNTNSVDYKTSVNDKLINYTLDFEFAYNKIQSAI